MLKGFRGFLAFPFFILPTSLFTQNNSVSPYSKVGLGELYSNNFSRGLAMGKSAIGLPDKLFINLSNPASYSNLALTTFEMGFEVELLRQKQSNPEIAIENSTSSLRYFSVGIPFTGWWGTAIALKPYSFRGYNITTERYLTNGSLITDNFEGNGGINQLIWGNSFKVAEGLAVGVNTAFLFGSLADVSNREWENSTVDTRSEESTSLKGIQLKYGAQYQRDFANETQLGLGFYFNNSQKIAADISKYDYTYSGVVKLDTLASSGKQSGNVTLPGEMGLGISWGKKDEQILNYAWLISADMELYFGSGYVSYSGKQELEDAFSFQLGGYLKPRYTFNRLKRSHSYLINIEYRLGAFYEQLPISLHAIQLQNYGISFGLGLPIKERGTTPGEVKINTINLGVILGRRGTLDNNLILENYLNINIGLTLNDKWFIKYKYR